jgi:hypothetical protein
MARAGLIGLSLLATAAIMVGVANAVHHQVVEITALVSISLLAYLPNLAWSLAFLGWSGHTVFVLWSTGVLWRATESFWVGIPSIL